MGGFSYISFLKLGVFLLSVHRRPAARHDHVLKVLLLPLLVRALHLHLLHVLVLLRHFVRLLLDCARLRVVEQKWLLHLVPLNNLHIAALRLLRVLNHLVLLLLGHDGLVAAHHVALIVHLLVGRRVNEHVGLVGVVEHVLLLLLRWHVDLVALVSLHHGSFLSLVAWLVAILVAVHHVNVRLHLRLLVEELLR